MNSDDNPKIVSEYLGSSELISNHQGTKAGFMSEKNGPAPKALGVAGAAKYLGVSHYKITRFIKLGLLQAHKDLNDERQKLIKISDLDRLKRQLESPVGDADVEGRELNSAAA